MWARLCEIFLACWLALSPFIFRHAPGETFLWKNDFLCSSAILFFSLLSFWKPMGKAHLGNVLIGFWLVAVTFLGASVPPPPAYQNYAVTGLLLLMLAILPSRSEQPPHSWQEFFEHRVD